MKHFSTHSFVAGFMLGALLVGAWWFGSDNPPLAFRAKTERHAPQAPAPHSDAVSVADQRAGSEVVVDSVSVPSPGAWVTVREMNGDELGNVLGAVRVNGPRNDVTVPLLRATVPGFTYAVELYRDDGDGAFDLSADSVYVDFVTGAPIIARFAASD